MSEIKYGCPLASQKDCIESDCAWWVKEYNGCAITVLAVLLEGKSCQR